MTTRLTYFGHSGTSIPETEIVYHILSSMLGSVEEEEIATNDSRIYTVLEIGFPVLYGDDFFALFTADKWRKLKNVITEIKKRSGKSQMKIVISFPGVCGVRGATTTRLVLQTMETDYKNVERAIDRVEVLVEIIESQMSEMPADVLEMTYCYESTHARWRPAFVKTVKSIYKYTNDNWKIID
ncbi:MAG: hypothetical protein WAM26_14150 [Nitrososphaeraceae archaeon]